MQSIPWGDPTQIALQPAVLLLPASVGAPRELAYGNCRPGCGRPAGSDSCRECLAGSYGTGDGVCRLCGPGLFGNASSGATDESVACTECPAGRYMPAWGAASCTLCPVGHICADGIELAPDLTLRSVAETGAIPLPTACPRGTYNPSTGKSEPAACLACATGRYRAGSAGLAASDCAACDAGYFAASAGAHQCAACAPSTYQPEAGMPSCDFCPLGFFSSVAAATACEQCPTGRYGVLDAAGAPRCEDCELGTYGEALLRIASERQEAKEALIPATERAEQLEQAVARLQHENERLRSRNATLLERERQRRQSLTS